MVDGEFIIGVSSNAIGAKFEFNQLGIQAVSFNR